MIVSIENLKIRESIEIDEHTREVIGHGRDWVSYKEKHLPYKVYAPAKSNFFNIDSWIVENLSGLWSNIDNLEEYNFSNKNDATMFQMFWS